MEEKSCVTISTKSWHYRLIQLVLGSLAPTPSTMHNLCPYFWLMIMSLLTFWFVLPIKFVFKGLSWLLQKIDNFIYENITKGTANSWYENLSDIDAYYILWSDKEVNSSYRKVFGNSYFSDDELIFEWWEKK
jgi:hypothetical protein